MRQVSTIFPNIPTPTNILAQATETLGFGTVGGDVDQTAWDKALAAAGGRHVGDMRQVMLLSKSVRGNEAAVTISARFGFAK